MAAIGASGLLGANPNGEVGQSTAGGKKTIGDTLGTLMPGLGGGGRGLDGNGNAMAGLSQVKQGVNTIGNSIAQAGSALGVGGGSSPQPFEDNISIAMKKGGKVSSASSRGDGIAQKGKTKGRIIGMSYGGKC
jgi:hypothetical protein